MSRKIRKNRRINKTNMISKNPKAILYWAINKTITRYKLNIIITHMDMRFYHQTYASNFGLTISSISHPQLDQNTFYLWGSDQSNKHECLVTYYTTKEEALAKINNVIKNMQDWAKHWRGWQKTYTYDKYQINKTDKPIFDDKWNKEVF